MPEGKLTWYTKKYEGVGIFLHCKLPSGRSLSYPFPMLRKDATYFFDVKRTVQTPEGDTVSETDSLRISVPNGKDLAIRAFREAKRIAQLEDVELLVSLQDVVNKEPSLKYTLTFMVMNATTKQWERGSTYGGMLTENVTQAVARDCMAWSMLRLESFPFYELVLSVHDEAVGEAPLDDPRASYKHMEEEMARGEDWSEGLPIAVEGWEGRMYRK
nr:bifunctional 3'-5' exonuclease/DNA polymerase [Achromobacter phage vB_Ade_ART]